MSRFGRFSTVLALLALCSCKNAMDYRKEADATEKVYLHSYQKAVTGRTEDFEIETPADTLRRRLMLDQNLLANDPASFGIRDMPTNLYWNVEERLLPGGEDPSLSIWKGGTNVLEIGLLDAVRIAAYNSRDYKSQKESLYQSALAMDLADDSFRTLFNGALAENMALYRSEDGKDDDTILDHRVISHGESASLGFSRRFTNGIRLTASIAANLAGMLTGDRRTAWGSSADLSVSVPLLRGSGTIINTESLTQAQRSFIYTVRSFEQYKRSFICSIESAYLSLVLAKRQQQTQDEAYRRVLRSTHRSYLLSQASRMSKSAFEQAHQSELSAKASWIASCQSWEQTKDSFKMTLGLPPDARIEPLEKDLLELEKYVEKYAQLVLKPYQVANKDEKGEFVIPQPDSVDEGDLKRRTDIAIQIAFTNRLDFVSARDRLEDAQRALYIAEDNLRAEVTLGASVNGLGTANGTMSEHGKFYGSSYHPENWRINPVLSIDLPLERRAERNGYRSALIAMEAAVRGYQSEEDSLKNSIRSAMRSMEQTKTSLQIQYIAMDLAERRVRNQEILLQAGRADMTVMLEAQDSLVSAKNALYSAMVSYKNQELSLQQQLGLLDVSIDGTWREADLVALGVLPDPERAQD